MAGKAGRMVYMSDNNKAIEQYTPLEGFYDLRDFNIPPAEFTKFVGIQKFLFEQELARRKGQEVQRGVRELSARYQQALFAYEKKENCI